ncbi:MAG: phosphoenolpyruvate synthase [Solobacterium sp.]|nr:phosphoenolpyruvate synthase [Solobacterium sp.]
MLCSRVKDCYASLWGVRAMHYRNASGYGTDAVALAVVIQEMVESDASGVLFTRNPAGNTDDMLINASYGLGEAVVSGIVSPDEYTVDRNGILRNVVIGSKELKIVYDTIGTAQVKVEEVERKQQVLSEEVIHSLFLLGETIEQHYGHPMDIEWAIKDGKVYILQARAITTIPEAASKQFSEADYEGLPIPSSASGKFRENVLFNLEKLPMPYYPLDHDFGNIVGSQKQVILGEAGIAMNDMCPINEDGISSFSISGMRPTGNLIHLPGILRQMKNESFNIEHSDAELSACKEALRREEDRSLSSVQEVGMALERMQKLIARTAYARFRYAIFPQVIENLSLNKTLAKIDSSINSYDLLEGLSYVTADMNRAMASLAKEVKERPDVQDAVMNQSYVQITKQYPEIKSLFSEFMDQFGHRADYDCYCFIAKSWNDDPDRFLHSLRTILRGGTGGTPTMEESSARFDELMRKACGVLGEKKYRKFETKVTAVRHYHQIREATQYVWEAEFAHCRNLLQRASNLLGESYEDLLYLFAEELYDLCRNGVMNEHFRQLIERRKEKRPLAESYWNYSIKTILETGSADIVGVSGSGGTATGKACIINGPEEFGKLQKGDILVCPHTDPEWTPLFTLASGVVVDTGGTLSHAAIVAREYKIPAVLAVGNATAEIKDGDTVMVDGDHGKVLIL